VYNVHSNHPFLQKSSLYTESPKRLTVSSSSFLVTPVDHNQQIRPDLKNHASDKLSAFVLVPLFPPFFHLLPLASAASTHLLSQLPSLSMLASSSKSSMLGELAR
jgi:hypothetical protein